MVAICPAGQLVWGMQLPVQSKSKTFAEPWEVDAGPAELVAVTRAVEAAGGFYVAVCDHTAIPADAIGEHMRTTWYDTWTTLGWLAAATERVYLMSHVSILSYKHPLFTAKSVCTLDALSNGRAILGVGAGHLQGEFEVLGIDFAQRGKLLDDALPVVVKALEEEFPDADGVFNVRGQVGIAPRPVQSPRPPVWVGGSSAAAIRRAATMGDGWLPQGTPKDEMKPFLDALAAQRDALGKHPADAGAITDWLYVGEPGWDTGARPVQSGEPDEIAASLREYAEMGVKHLQVRFPSRTLSELTDQIAAFGSEVAPLL